MQEALAIEIWDPLNPQQSFELIKFAIENGADINKKINWDSYNALEMAQDSNLINFLKNYGAKCGINTERTKDLIEQEELYLYRNNTHIFAKQLTDNLHVAKGYINKIPYVVHHVWLTHSSNPRELFADDIENILKTKEKFQQTNKQWHHIVWTNDKNLIPLSIEILEINGIEVRSMQDFKDSIRSIKKINSLIETKQFGIASDLLRYNVMEKIGGVYMDLNYEIMRVIDNEMYKYDFFASSFINNFFAAKPNHPIFKNLVDKVESILNNPPEYIKNIGIEEVFVKLFFTTLVTFGLAYMKYANQEGNIDIVYPHTEAFFDLNGDPWLEDRECNAFWNIISFSSSLGICGAKDLLIGVDGYKGAHLTWIINE